MKSALGAAGAILHYLKQQLRRQIDHISRLTSYHDSSYVTLDAATQTNLELVDSRASRDTSLLGALDRTVTPMGARKLRDWILHPLRHLEPLLHRQQLVADLLAEPFILSKCRESLRSIRDIERTVGRLSQAGGNARDLLSLKNSLDQIPEIKSHLQALLQNTHFGSADAAQTRSLATVIDGDLKEFPDLVSTVCYRPRSSTNRPSR